MNVVETFRAHPVAQAVEYMRTNNLGLFDPAIGAPYRVTADEWVATFGPRKMVAGDIRVDD